MSQRDSARDRGKIRLICSYVLALFLLSGVLYRAPALGPFCTVHLGARVFFDTGNACCVNQHVVSRYPDYLRILCTHVQNGVETRYNSRDVVF